MTIPKIEDSGGIVVFDTSVILHDSNSVYGFDNLDVVIPLIVLDEIDKFRSLDNETGRNARDFIRELNSLRGEDGLLNEGIPKGKGNGSIFVAFLENSGVEGLTHILDSNKNDDKILAVCLSTLKENPGVPVSLVTKDIALTVKANVLGIKCSDYHADTQVRDVSQLYTGLLELFVPSEVVDLFYYAGATGLDTFEHFPGISFYNNMGVTLIDDSKASHTAVCIYSDGRLKPLKFKNKLGAVSAQNREQTMAMEMMLDEAIKLVTLTGPAGTGKTLCAVACGLHMVMDNNTYDRVVVSRPIQPLGKDLGYLPGDLYEKMEPWVGPIKDAVEFIFGGDRNKLADLMHFGVLDIEPLTYIRGRSLPRTLFILDEAQNLTRHEMKTIISRIGKGSKIILTGDIFQIDNNYLDTVTNGLTCVVEKFKPSHLAGHVNLVKGQRSELATLAADIL